MTQAYFKRFFGDQVKIEYYDMAVPAQYAEKKVLVESVESRHRVYPMVFIDGEFKLAGSAEFYDIVSLVQEALAILEK
ncbi:MAG: hypothetical protein A2Y73_09265 [Chloroflexi bacterium RBG_13_56_8]|nr:MAG: hypothetical protein A2Y73_09265 [Chloroflexi bacterium RBG_13_56_8]